MARTITKNLLAVLGLGALVALTFGGKPTEGVLTFLMALLVRPSNNTEA